MISMPFREIALSLLVGVVVAASPMTTREWLPSLLAGALVVAGMLYYRARFFPEVEPQKSQSHRALWPLSVISALVLYVAIVSPTLLWLWEQWTASVWINNHGIFIPLVVGYLAYQALSEQNLSPPDSSPWGFLWLGASLLLLTVDAFLETKYLSVLSICLALPGLSLLFLGPERTRRLRVPLALTLLAIPIPNAVSTDLYLRHVTAVLVEPVIRTLGFATYREATVLILPTHRFVVAEACSGFNTLYASLATAIILACYLKTTPQRLMILLVAPLIAVLANVLRVSLLVWLTLEMGNWILESPLHPATGVLAFLIAVGTLIGLSSYFVSQERRKESSQ